MATDIQKQLYTAIKNGNIEETENLLKRGANPNIMYGNLSPLHWAINFCYNNNNKDGNEHIYKDIVKHLIDYDADTEIACEGYTPIQFAGYTQCLKIINILNRGKEKSKKSK